MKIVITRSIVVFAAGAILLATLACQHKEEMSPKTPDSIRNVELLMVQQTKLPGYYEAVGTVRPVQSAQLSSQMMGNIIRMTAREGDYVRQGQVLAVIDDSQTRASLDSALAAQRASVQEVIAANSEFALAESTLKRYQVLQDKKSVSPHEFEQVNARYEAAKAHRNMAQAGNAGADAAVIQARTVQGHSTVRAPFAGIVTAKLAEVGNLASPGVPLYSVEDNKGFRLEVNVDESSIGIVRLGATVPVALDAFTDKTFTGKVVQILPSADDSSRTFLVKVELPKDASLRAGLFGRARFATGARDGISVPQSAIVQRGSMQAVYAVGPDQVASLRYVTLGQSSQNGFEVLSGLENGDRIVVAPANRELNGKKIEVR